MPTGPRGQVRPAGVTANAVRVMEIATGQRDEEYVHGGKDPSANTLSDSEQVLAPGRDYDADWQERIEASQACTRGRQEGACG